LINGRPVFSSSSLAGGQQAEGGHADDEADPVADDLQVAAEARALGVRPYPAAAPRPRLWRVATVAVHAHTMTFGREGSGP
jgi:hypothetical protein